jgi:hypothetical protein
LLFFGGDNSKRTLDTFRGNSYSYQWSMSGTQFLGEKMDEQKAFEWSIFGFMCGFICSFLGIMTHSPFSIILGIVGMILNGRNMLYFMNN